MWPGSIGSMEENREVRMQMQMAGRPGGKHVKIKRLAGCAWDY